MMSLLVSFNLWLLFLFPVYLRLAYFINLRQTVKCFCNSCQMLPTVTKSSMTKESFRLLFKLLQTLSLFQSITFIFQQTVQDLSTLFCPFYPTIIKAVILSSFTEKDVASWKLELRYVSLLNLDRMVYKYFPLWWSLMKLKMHLFLRISQIQKH